MNVELRPKEIARFHAKVQRQEGCWVWPGEIGNTGYGIFRIYRSGKTKKLFAHRVAHFLASGEDITNLVVRHDCDNPPCCNPSHLRSGTQADNMRDSIERKRANLAGLAKGYERQAKRLLEKLIAQEKRCPACEIVKPLDAFHRARGAVDGRQGWCKDCRSQQLREAWQNDPDFRNRELARKRERRTAQPKVEKPPRTHCFKAHEMSPENTGPRGQCKQCARDRARRAQERKRANVDLQPDGQSKPSEAVA
ncbi:HNH endonuclease [Nonomuraea sp. NPDC026600]|uniref:HNH endonuclease n=1 Tax=Nonomuraea sp. NPDC026600 TaxID=3155363 RepID=UPI0033D814ED